MSVLVGLAGKIIIIMPHVIIITKVIELLISIFLEPRTKKKLSGKKVMMFGPPKSGKSTFKDWLMDGKPKPKGEYHQNAASEEHRHFHDEKNNIDYEILDRGGAPEFLVGVGQSLYESHDVILMFFNVEKYISDDTYKAEVNALFDMLATLYKKNKKSILIIGSYKDELSKQQRQFSSNLINLIDSSKEYFQFLCSQSYVLVDMYDKKDVARILKEMKQVIEKQ